MRARLETLAAEHPVWFAAGLGLAWHAVLFALAELVGPATVAWFPDLGSALVNAGTAAVTLAFIAWMGWWRQAALAPRQPDRRWLALLPVTLLVLTYAAPGLEGTTAGMASTALTMLAVGVSEEADSRGAAQHVAARLGTVRGALLVALVFGLGHGLSTLWLGRPLDDGVAQVISATAFGYCWAAMRWQLGTIWPLVVLHAVDNFLQVHSPGAAPWWWQLTVAAFMVAYGHLLLGRLPYDAPVRPAGAPA